MSLLSLLLIGSSSLILAIPYIELLSFLFLEATFSKTFLIGLSENVYLGVPSSRIFSVLTPKRL